MSEVEVQIVLPDSRGHPHHHSPAHGSRRRLSIVLLLTAVYMVAELLGGLWTGSLALLADAGHMLADVAALVRRAMVTLPAPPAWAPAAPVTVWTVDEIKAEFAKVTSTPPQVNFVRTTFLRPDQAWLVRFKGWFRALEKPLKLRFEDQLWDCDNYANCFVAFADLLTLQSGETRGALCVGWATVYYQRPFAGINGGAHAVAVAGTSQGLYIIEPQDGTMVALRDYPNRDTIEAVYF